MIVKQTCTFKNLNEKLKYILLPKYHFFKVFLIPLCNISSINSMSHHSVICHVKPGARHQWQNSEESDKILVLL